MNAEFFEALAMLEAERGLSAEYLLEKIKNAIVIAVKKDYDVEDDNVAVEIDPETGKFNVNLLKHYRGRGRKPEHRRSAWRTHRPRRKLQSWAQILSFP